MSWMKGVCTAKTYYINNDELECHQVDLRRKQQAVTGPGNMDSLAPKKDGALPLFLFVGQDAAEVDSEAFFNHK